MEKIMRSNLINQPAGLKKQAGATFLGMMFIGGAIVFIALIAMKIFPAYQEYFSVKTVVRALNKEPLSSMSKKEIQDSFNRRANTGYVTVVTGADLTLDKNSAGETVASVQYQVVKPLFGNISVQIDFATSSDGK
jgi:Tfp pilus assembly major pilin PilA